MTEKTKLPKISKGTPPIVDLADALGDVDTMPIWADVKPGRGPESEALDREWMRMLPPDKPYVMRLAGYLFYAGYHPVECLRRARNQFEDDEIETEFEMCRAISERLKHRLEHHKAVTINRMGVVRAVVAIYRVVCTLPEEWWEGDEPVPAHQLLEFAYNKLMVDIPEHPDFERAWKEVVTDVAEQFREFDRQYDPADEEIVQAVLRAWQPDAPAATFRQALNEKAAGRATDADLTAAATSEGAVFTTPPPPKRPETVG